VTHIAFLRAINVGKRVVKMQDLRRVLEAAGFEDVETVIQSGNVVLSSRSRGPALERKIEAALEAGLGYPVGTYVRTPEELSQVAAVDPFGPGEPRDGHTLSVAFLRAPLDPERVEAVRALSTSINLAEVTGREAWWLRKERSDASMKFAVRFGRVVGSDCTVRNITTVRRIVEKYCR
jgi:uncharacterized protein (DUF1697 family)